MILTDEVEFRVAAPKSFVTLPLVLYRSLLFPTQIKHTYNLMSSIVYTF